MDQSLFMYLNNLAFSIPKLGALAVIVAKFGIVLYAVLLLWQWWRGSGDPNQRRRGLLLVVLAAVLALGVNAVMNVAVPRFRPFLTLPAHVLVPRPADPSFPSDHAAFSSAIGIMLLAMGDGAWGAFALLGVVGLGTARVMVGVHYPSDILGGMAVGAASVLVVLLAQKPLRPLLNFTIAIARLIRLA